MALLLLCIIGLLILVVIVFNLPECNILLYYSVQFDGSRVVSGAYDYLVRVWDPIHGQCLHILQGHTNRVYSLQVNSNLL